MIRRIHDPIDDHCMTEHSTFIHWSPDGTAMHVECYRCGMVDEWTADEVGGLSVNIPWFLNGYERAEA